MQETQERKLLQWFAGAYAIILLASLSIRPLWVDEIICMALIRTQTYSELLNWIAGMPGGTPLYYAAQQFFSDILGFSTFASRLPSAICGVLTCFAVYELAKRLSIQLPLAAVVIVAILPNIFRYSWEARPYSMALLFMLIAWIAHTDQRWWLYGLSVLAGLYAQPYMIFGVLGFTRNRKALPWLIAAAAAFAPWLLYVLRQNSELRTMTHYFFSIGQVSPLIILRELAGGGYFPAVALVLLAVLGLRNRLPLLAVVATTVAGPIIADAAANYFFAIRQVIFVLPALALLAAEGLNQKPKALGYALAAVLALVSVRGSYVYLHSGQEDWEKAAELTAKHLGSDACLLVLPAQHQDYLNFFRPELGLRRCKENPERVVAVITNYSSSQDTQALADLMARHHLVSTEQGPSIRLIEYAPR